MGTTVAAIAAVLGAASGVAGAVESRKQGKEAKRGARRQAAAATALEAEEAKGREQAVLRARKRRSVAGAREPGRRRTILTGGELGAPPVAGKKLLGE